MANEEEKGYEPVIKPTEAPSRVDGKEKPKTRVAKLTKRTIESLKKVIKDGRLNRAYRKYNDKYAKMRRSLMEANEVRTAYDNGEEKSQSKVYLAHERVAYYDKKLAKFGAKLLISDIKELAHARAVSAPKPIKVPRFVAKAFPRVTNAIAAAYDAIREKKLEKSMVKEMKKGTKEYIKSSLDGALFKNEDARVLRDKPDAEVIKGLAIDRKSETFDEKIAGLRKFISADGKTPLLDEENLGINPAASTDVPPVEPEASVKKEEIKVTEEELLGDLVKKPVAEETKIEEEPKKTESVEETKEEKAQPRVTVDDLMKNLGSTPVAKKEDDVKSEENTDDQLSPKTEETAVEISESDKELISRRKREIATITALGNTVEILKRQAENTTDPDTKAAIEGYIQAINNDLNNIISRSMKKEEKVAKAEDSVKEETVANETMDPIIVTPKEEAKKEELKVESSVEKKSASFTLKDGREVTVRVKETPVSRAEQISTPSVLRVTPEDIRKMEEKNSEIQTQISTLTKEKEDLLAQKAMYERLIELDRVKKEGTMQVQRLTEETTALKDEVSDLGVQAAPIMSGLGRTK